ncbi:DUF4328 domain-containing protein [Streptacidiphilus sp. P02-A3a]|uniref:DUF4328 domain-containing protein n=1 Tax=Streptacidiphilus sp. P02-A3a TaxID=2704468 RepID=UPI0015FA8999|nr:DUF4328 domain-containing protein [Streptacidiphilus sp. P02-A3a]QMU68647.1 DUF4328 domain-containing protein [Streptacidiphilus sp. P02-A3a]
MGQPPKAPTGLAIATQVLLGVQAFTGVGALVSDGIQFASLEQNGDVSTPASVIGGFSALLTVPTGVATIVLFIIWCHTARSNADVILPRSRTYARGWAIGGWFVPIGWFWIPRYVLGDTWEASRPLGADPRRTSTRSALLNGWWLCWCGMWVVSLVSGIVDGAASVNAGGTANLATSTLEAVSIISLVASVLRVAAALLALFVVRKVTTFQQVRILQGPGEGHPYAAVAQQQYLPYAPAQAAGYPYPAGYPYQAAQPYQPVQPYQQFPQQAPAPSPAPVATAPVPTAPAASTPVDALPVDAVPGPVPVEAPAPEPAPAPAAAPAPAEAPAVDLAKGAEQGS